MSELNLPLSAAFGWLREPVLLVEDHTIIYMNPAAGSALPSLKVGAPSPPAFDLLASDTVSVLPLEGKSWSCESQTWADRLILHLSPAEAPAILPDHRIPNLLMRIGTPISSLSYGHDYTIRQLNKEQLELLKGTIARENKALARLTRTMRMLTLASLPDGDLPFDYYPQDLNLTGFLNDTLRQLEYPLSLVQAQVSLINNTKNLTVHGDRSLLQTLIFHLVSNAMQAAGANCQLTFRLDRYRSLALISIEDNGPGMPEEKLSAIFSSSRVIDPMQDPKAGIGLGLTVARKIALLHGGALVLTNLPQRGLRATFSLDICSPKYTPMGKSASILSSPSKVDSSNGIPLVLRELSEVLSEHCYYPENKHPSIDW